MKFYFTLIHSGLIGEAALLAAAAAAANCGLYGYEIYHFNASVAPQSDAGHAFAPLKLAVGIVSYISMSRSGRETRCSRCNLKTRSKSCFNNRRAAKLFYERSGYRLRDACFS